MPARDLRALRGAHREGRLVPFLGAGVSVEQGVPAWRELVLSMLFDRGHGAGLVERLPPTLRAAVTAWLTGHLGYDLAVLARVVEVSAPRGERWTEREFLEQLRRRLYPKRRRPPAGPTTLDAVADFIAEGAREGRVPAVITLNYDDLLERALRARGVPHYPVWSARRTRGAGLPVLHPHGFLPRRGVPDDPGVVFSETHYHRLSGELFQWGVDDVVHHLRHHCALFVGLSLSDPNLRRLLDAAHVPGHPPTHWQVQLRRASSVASARELALRIAAGAEGEVSAADVARSLRAGMQTAERFDRALHESMGVTTVWIDRHADIAPLLARLRPPSR